MLDKQVMSQATDYDASILPGYRRAICVAPAPQHITAYLEDDFHGMAVRLEHDAERVVTVEAFTDRMPWTTCPGAVAKLVATFEGRLLADVTARRDKKSNCTHLHDLAVLAAVHAGDRMPLRFDFAVSDPRDGMRILEGRCGDLLIHRWIDRDGMLIEPEEIQSLSLFTLRDWIARLKGREQEVARLLQWAAIVAHGRTIPSEQQREASALPANCYAFQPERADLAQRTGGSFDFSEGSRVPLKGLRDRMRTARSRKASHARAETQI